MEKVITRGAAGNDLTARKGQYERQRPFFRRDAENFKKKFLNRRAGLDPASSSAAGFKPIFERHWLQDESRYKKALD